MSVAKGQIQPDKTYLYTCGNCLGEGVLPNGETCSHCHNLNYEALITDFATARGERYYALLKAILSIKGKAVYDRAVEIRKENGKFTAFDFGRLLLEFGFPRNRMKPLAEWLEETRFCRYGTWENIQDGGLKVKDILTAVCEKYPELQKVKSE